MNKPINDARTVQALTLAQRGVFSTADLRIALSDPHPAGFVRRVRTLVDAGVLRRFHRGWYVAEEFDLPTLSQRIAPGSIISFETVLARALLIGTRPSRRVTAVKRGRTRTYSAFGFEISHVGIAPHLDFGAVIEEGIWMATPEKAALDVLYFYQRGRRYPFDIYSDVAYERLDTTRLREYLDRYRNSRFLAFARKVLEL